MAWGRVDILALLTIQSLNMRYLFLCVFFSFFPQYLTGFVYKSFTSLVIFFPKYFIVFGATISGIVFFISFSDRPVMCAHRAAGSLGGGPVADTLVAVGTMANSQG